MALPKLLLNNALVFDGVDYLPHERRSVCIVGERIDSIGAPRSAREDETVIELGGRTVLPGLIDAHFHCNSPSLKVSSADTLAASHMAQYARKYLESMLLRGFTTVRDAGGADVGLVRAIDEGLIEGPRLFISGRAISQTGGHGDLREGLSVCGCSGYVGSLSCIVDGEDNMRAHVREQLRLGARQIKLFVSGGVLSPTDPIWMEQFTDAEIAAAVEEASRWRTYVMAHALTAASVRRCVRLGVRSIEHGADMDDATAEAVAASDSFIVPTLSIIDGLLGGTVAIPPTAAEKIKQFADKAYAAVRICHAHGVRLGLGTDLLGALHGRESGELTLRASISGALETLRSATSINASLMMQSGQLGAVRAGALADLLVVDDDPIQNIEQLANPDSGIKMILKGGRIIKDILAATAQAGRAHSSPSP